MLCLFFLCSFNLSAFQVSGVILDSETKQILSYVNIGIAGKNVGTVSDENGKFALEISEEMKNEQLKFSFIGYEDKILNISGIISGKEELTVSLTPTVYMLEDIIVKPKNYKTKIVGNTTKSQGIEAGFSEHLLGYEAGVLMKIKARPTFIEEVVFTINNCSYDSIFYRLNIYEMTKNGPGRNILRKPIYISYSKEDLEETIVVDLTELNVFVEDDFVVTLEHVKDLGDGVLNFSVGLFNGGTWHRETSQGGWKKLGIAGLGISALIKYETQ